MLASAAPLDLSAWKYRKRIPLTPGDGLTIVKLDREVYTGSSNWLADLRLIRDAQEIPFVLRTLGAQPEPVVEVEELLDRSVVPGVGLQFVIHLRRAAKHNSVVLQTEEKNFRQRVRIETSQSGVRWATVRDDGAIFNFSQDGRELSSTMVEYPVSTRPFLRVTVFGWHKTDMVTSATVDQADSQPAVYEIFSTLVPQVWEDPETKSTVVSTDQGVTGLPVSRIRLETSSPQFQRAVAIETSDDGKNWQYLVQHAIARLPGPEFTEESLLMPAAGAHRYLRLRIYNRDDQPIQIGKVSLEGLVSEIAFLAPSSGAYWLYYGNPAVTRLSEYDLGAVLARGSFHENSWILGPAEINPGYRAPAAPTKPWSEQHPAILYTVLGGAVLALGIATFRFAARLR
ncbi:MAG: DUF3999 family protein [Bryobacteraceae bacterium]